MSSNYLTKVLNRAERKNIIHAAIEKLGKVADQFDAIAVTGSSGLLVGPSIADALDKNLILVRKDKDRSHSCLAIEHDGIYNTVRYLIIDDMIASGDTLKSIHAKIEENSNEFVYVGTYLYNQSDESAERRLCCVVDFHNPDSHIAMGGYKSQF